MMGEGRPPWLRFVAAMCLDGAISPRLALNAVATERKL